MSLAISACKPSEPPPPPVAAGSAVGSAAATTSAAASPAECAKMDGVMEAVFAAMEKDQPDPVLTQIRLDLGPGIKTAIVARCAAEKWPGEDVRCLADAALPGNESKDCTGPAAEKITDAILATMSDAVKARTDELAAAHAGSTAEAAPPPVAKPKPKPKPKATSPDPGKPVPLRIEDDR